MPELPDLVHLPIKVDTQDYTESVLNIISSVKPGWDILEITVKPMSEGFVNLLLLCSAPNDEEKLMVRVFGNNQGLNECFHRDSEIQTMRVLAHEKIITPLYCSFENGIVYAFAPGSTFGREVLQDEKMQRLICSAMHALHQVDFLGYLGDIPRPGLLIFTDRPWQVIQANDYSHMEQSHRYQAVLPPLNELQKQQAVVHQLYNELCERYPLVYTHADLHTHNMVHDKAAVSEAQFSTPACRKQILETYLSSHPQHGKQGPVSAEVLSKWYTDSLRASMVSCFNIVSFTLACIKTSPKEADFLTFSMMFYKKFLRFKEELEQLGESV